ncbi:MAG: recombinase family protein, partial [Clostridia bacterium]|nr:recombinase family protein [Clostridia bacterium]
DDAQDGMSISIETQIKILGDYCRENGINVYSYYRDDGFTGTNFNRPSFKRMMRDAENGLINCIVVKDLSRFGRNYLQVGNYLGDILPAMNVRFIAIGDNVDSASSNLDYDLMVPIKNIFNEHYPAECSRKTRQAFIAKAQSGEFIGSQAPYGYRKSKSDKHVLEIDEAAAPVVLEIFQMAAYKGYGYNKIARVLTERKVITPAAYQAQQAGREYTKDPYEWNLTTVWKMFENQTYLGHLVSGKRRKASFKSTRIIKQDEEQWIVVRDMFPALISDQLWNDAHHRLETRKQESRSGFVNIFAGLLKCDRCGYALGIANAKNRNNYFMCNTYKKKGPERCSSHYIMYDELYEVVLRDIQQMLYEVKNNKDEFLRMVMAKINADDASEGQQIEREIEALEKRIAELETKFDRLYDDRLDGILSDKKFKELSAKCEAEQESASARLAELKSQAADRTDSVQGITQFMKTAEQYDEVTELDKELLNRLVDSIVVGDRIKTANGCEQVVTVNYKFIGEI